MDYKMHESILDSIRDTEKSMRVAVKIPSDEVDRLVVTTLIRIRNADVNSGRDMDHFDTVIRHYLSEDEFLKYVIHKHEME